ncbi:actin interacting protein 3-domain-containing protein [Umbelopsis sp. PMI_123]|nr:actin interacting protein 3-domain-containing protein [Umbelopsis sp. PMI_123]
MGSSTPLYDTFSTNGSQPFNTNSQRRVSEVASQTGEIEQTVTQLLRTTKNLLETLTLWSQGRAGAHHIHEIYSSLRAQFQNASDAFEAEGINMSDLRNVPTDLYDCVNRALREEPSTSVLEQHLPSIRDIIVHLLHGLRSKQALFREKGSLSRQSSGSRHGPVSPRRTDGDGYMSSQPYRPSETNEPPAPSSPGYPPQQQQQQQQQPQQPPQTHFLPPSPPPVPPRQSSVKHFDQWQPPQPMPMGSPSGSGLGLISMPTPNPTPSLTVPGQETGSFGYENGSSEAGVIRRQLDSKSSLRSRSIVRRRKSQFPPPRDPKESPTLPREQMNAISEEQESPAIPEVFSPRDSLPQVRRNVPLQDIDSHTSEKASETLSAVEAPSVPKSSLLLFLQVGKEVKKVAYDGELTIPALQLLFMDKFNYTSGQLDFPHIYIRDPAANLSYQLEDVSEVQNKSLLTLNFEAAEDKRIVELESQIVNGFESVNTDMAQFRNIIVDTLESFRRQMTEAQLAMESREIVARQHTPSDAGKSVPQSQVVDVKLINEIKTEQHNLNQLRRDLAVVRQMHSEFQTESRDMMEKLKNAVKEREAAHPITTAADGPNRRSQDEVMEKLEVSSTAITTRLEELQDVVDEIKVDVTQRRCRPSKAQLNHCSEEANALDKEIKELSKLITTAKPVWKKTWEEELQTILKEQQFIKEKESLVVDLEEDYSTLMDVFSQLQKITDIQATAAPTKREFNVGPTPEGFEGMSSVMKEVSMIDVDSSRRLRALNQAEKMRQRELDNRIDEFEHELTSFVDSKKLKRTGGAEEAERERQRKDQLMLKQLYSNNNNNNNNNNNVEPEHLEEV